MQEKEFDFFKADNNKKTNSNLFLSIVFSTLFTLLVCTAIRSIDRSPDMLLQKDNKNIVPPISNNDSISLDNRPIIMPINFSSISSSQLISKEEIQSLIPITYNHFLFDRQFNPIKTLDINAINRKDIFVDMFLKGDPKAPLIVEKIIMNKNETNYFVRTHVLYKYTLDMKSTTSIDKNTSFISDHGDFIYHIIKKTNQKAMIESFKSAQY